MAYAFPPDVRQLIQEAENFGEYVSEDDVLRDALSALIRQNEDLAAIREGIADMEAGRFRPVSEVDAEIRRKLGFATGR